MPLIVLLLWAATSRAAEPGEDAIFGGPDDNATAPDDNATAPDDNATTPMGILGPKGEGGLFWQEPPKVADPFAGIHEDPLALGGQLYLRLSTIIADRGSVGEQSLSMPNLLDLYLDARPEERVRGFVSGRLSFDPTVGAGDKDLLGAPRTSTKVILDQLWLKTDIARAVFLTLGQERIKWGATRLWNPNDFVNQHRKDPLALFDERTGVPMLKVHIPYDTFNFYLVGLLGAASRLDEPGAAFRFEAAFPASEIALSGIAGKGRKTAFGFDLSTALGPFDVAAEVSLTDETDTPVYSGHLDFATLAIPTEKPRGTWLARVAASFQYAFKPNDDDVMYLGLEYFWNPGGVDDANLYPWLLVKGGFEPFYLGQHYLGLTWVVPQPGSWDDTTFTLSALGNLSDTSFITRLDFSQTLHTKLRLEAYAQAHYGKRGGELRFAIDVPALPPIPDVLPDGLEAFSVPAPAVMLGLNLRLAI